jgi:hypothetical protein
MTFKNAINIQYQSWLRHVSGIKKDSQRLWESASADQKEECQPEVRARQGGADLAQINENKYKSESPTNENCSNVRLNSMQLSNRCPPAVAIPKNNPVCRRFGKGAHTSSHHVQSYDRSGASTFQSRSETRGLSGGIHPCSSIRPCNTSGKVMNSNQRRNFNEKWHDSSETRSVQNCSFALHQDTISHVFSPQTISSVPISS